MSIETTRNCGRIIEDQVGVIEKQLARARSLYETILQSGELPDDRVLARSPAYRDFLALGLSIRSAVSQEDFEEMTANFYAGQPAASARSARHLSHLWAGLASMQ